MSENLTIPDQDLHHSIEKGISYLYEHQLPNGEYISYYAPDDRMQEWCVPDSIVFSTSVISTSLLKFRGHSKVKEMLALSVNFLKYQMMRGGVWNYFTKWNPLFEYTPADIDDTVYTSLLLHNLGIEFTENKSTVLSNRNTVGLFYTWFIIRKENLVSGKQFSIMARELKRPLKSILFWKKHQGGRNDIDVGVNANILYYLGVCDETKAIISYLTNVILENKESEADKWYKNPLILYYFISRNHPDVNFVEDVRQKIIERTFSFYQNNGSFCGSALETALAVMALLNFGHFDDRLKTSIAYLIRTQKEPGNWDRHIFFYSGPSKTTGWGSEELTTSFCIEAIHQYKNLTTR